MRYTVFVFLSRGEGKVAELRGSVHGSAYLANKSLTRLRSKHPETFMEGHVLVDYEIDGRPVCDRKSSLYADGPLHVHF